MESLQRNANSAMTSLHNSWRFKPVATASTLGGVIVLLVFMVWVVAKMVDSGSRISSVTDGVLSLMQPSNIDADRMPRFTNGTEYGVSCWIYINEPPRTAELSPIISVGGTAMFQLDMGRSNVLVKFPVFGSGEPHDRDADASFDHVSLKRWVHLMALHVDGTITLFKDGELYSVNRLGRVDVTQPAGAIRVGGHPIDAYVSSVVFLNHFPSDRQVKRLYGAGPRHSNRLFRMMGFDNIGVRSPVYQISE